MYGKQICILVTEPNGDRIVYGPYRVERRADEAIEKIADAYSRGGYTDVVIEKLPIEYR